MRRALSPLSRFLKRDDGPTAVEYALVLALIIVVCVFALTALGINVTRPFKKYSQANDAVHVSTMQALMVTGTHVAFAS